MKRGLAMLITMMILTLACSLTEKILRPTVPAATTVAASSAPSVTPTPGSTFTPTFTPLATATPACIPSPDDPAALPSAQAEIDAFAPGARVTWYDDFLCSDLSYGWASGFQNPTLTFTARNSILTINAQEEQNVYDGIHRLSPTLGDNRGMSVLFRYQAGSTINLFIITGNWMQPDCRRWGLDDITTLSGKPMWEGWEGSTWLSGDFPSGVLRPGAWYYLLIRLGGAGQVTMKVWEKDHSENHADFQRAMGAGWAGRSWNPLFQVYQGTLDIDEYWEMTFPQTG